MTLHILLVDSPRTCTSNQLAMALCAMGQRDASLRLIPGDENAQAKLRAFASTGLITHLFVRGWFPVPEDVSNMLGNVTFRRFHSDSDVPSLIECLTSVPATCGRTHGVGEAESSTPTMSCEDFQNFMSGFFG